MMILFTYLLCFFSLNLIAEPIPFAIIHTNDLHSYVGGQGPDGQFTPEVDGDKVVGHYARLTTLIKNIREQRKDQPILTIDAGDFYSGTLFQVLGPNPSSSYAPEIEFFTHNQFDFTTFGNHEFDSGIEGLTLMLNKLKNKKNKLKIISSNLDFKSLPEEFEHLAKSDGVISDFGVKTFQYDGKTLNVGVFGLTGPHATRVSQPVRGPIKFYGFNDETLKEDLDAVYEVLREKIKIYKDKYKLDLIVVTMHAGAPEDEKIAQNVEGIDVIIAGHTHTLYKEPRKINNVIIAQAECYGRYVGILDFQWDGKKLSLLSNGPTYREANDSVPSDPVYLAKTNSYIDEINKVMKEYNYLYNSYIFEAGINLERKNESHNPVGRLVSTAISEQMNELLTEKVSFYFNSLGMVRKDLSFEGKSARFQFSDIFKFLPLGLDKDNKPGYPIVTFYFSKKEVRQLINFMEIYRHFSKDFVPIFSESLTYEVNNWGIPMVNRLNNLKLNGKPYNEWPDFIKIATTSFIASYVNKVTKLSYGLVDLSPKRIDGTKGSIEFTPFKEFKLLSDYLKKKKNFPYKD